MDTNTVHISSTQDSTTRDWCGCPYVPILSSVDSSVFPLSIKIPSSSVKDSETTTFSIIKNPLMSEIRFGKGKYFRKSKNKL